MWRLKNAGLPWTLVPYRTSLWSERSSHGALGPLYVPTLGRAAMILRSRGAWEGQTHDPQPCFSLFNVHHSLQFRSPSCWSSPYVITHRLVIVTTCQGVRPNL